VNGASGYSAIWRGCGAFEGGLFNDLVAYGSNGLIATVMLDKTLVGDKDPTAFLFSGAKTGYLAEWNPRTGWKHLPGSEAALNNGIQLSADSRLAWSTAWTSRQVLEYDLRTADHPQRDVPFPDI
jgi:sugar lactone lactonase YvrE